MAKNYCFHPLVIITHGFVTFLFSQCNFSPQDASFRVSAVGKRSLRPHNCGWLVTRLWPQSQNSQWAIVCVHTAFFFARFFFLLWRRRLPAPHELGWADSNWLTTLAGSMWRQVDVDSGSGFGGVREPGRSIRRSRLHCTSRPQHVPSPVSVPWCSPQFLRRQAHALFPAADRLALHLPSPDLFVCLPCANRGLFVLSRLPPSWPPVSRIG